MDKILWVDCLGGLIVGVVVIVLSPVISVWECLPIHVVAGMGIALVPRLVVDRPQVDPSIGKSRSTPCLLIKLVDPNDIHVIP